MEQLAADVMNPKSPRYQIYYTPEEIRDLVAPSDVEYKQLVQTLESRGMKVIRESKSHLIITVRTDTASVPRTFNTEVKTVREMGVGTTEALSIPGDLDLVDSVIGFDQTAKMRPKMQLFPKAKPIPNAIVNQQQIKQGYGFNPIYTSGVTGKGQDIAIATYDGFHMEDVNGFFVQSKISPAPTYDVVQFNGKAEINEDSAVETALDAEFAGMIAPGSKIHVFASAENSDAGELAMFTAILDDNRSKVVNYSWGHVRARTWKLRTAPTWIKFTHGPLPRA